MKHIRSNGSIIGALVKDYTTDSGVFDLDLAVNIPPPPAFQVVGVSYNTDVADYDVALPAGVQDGDLLLFSQAHDNASHGLDMPSGFTSIFDSGSSAAPNHRMLAYAIMSSSIADPLPTDNSGAYAPSCMVIAIRGVDTVDEANKQKTFDTGGMPNPPSINATAGRYVIAVGVIDDDSVTNVTAPAGYTLLGSNAAGYQATVMAAYKQITTSGTEDPEAFGGSGTDSWEAGVVEVYKV